MANYHTICSLKRSMMPRGLRGLLSVPVRYSCLGSASCLTTPSPPARRCPVGRASCPSVGSSRSAFCLLSACFCSRYAASSEIEIGDDAEKFKIEIGDGQALYESITKEVQLTERKVLNFEHRYKKFIRPMLVSRCLVSPYGLNHPMTAFLHRQTFKIANHNPIYLSAFDIMAYEGTIKDDEEWKAFLQHMIDRRVYTIEEWDSTLSTIESLMYDHGLKEPEDGSEVEFYKGECDASYNKQTDTSNLAFIIWKGKKILYSEVYKDIPCSSATEGEVFAAFALLSKSIELKISKLLFCSDCNAVCQILSGELSVGLYHKHRDLYLMLRSMKRYFKKMIPMWKPRELMTFVDELGKATGVVSSFTIFARQAWQRWSHQLKGSPLFRIERAGKTGKNITKFADVKLDESCAEIVSSVFFVEVEIEHKIDCLVGIKQSLRPDKLKLFINMDDKSDCMLRELENLGMVFQSKIRQYCVFTSSPIREPFFNNGGSNRGALSNNGGSDRCLEVLFDAANPQDHYTEGPFLVMLVTPAERKNMNEKILELSALTFIHFNGVRLPLNEPSMNLDKRVENAKEEEEIVSSSSRW